MRPEAVRPWLAIVFLTEGATPATLGKSIFGQKKPLSAVRRAG